MSSGEIYQTLPYNPLNVSFLFTPSSSFFRVPSCSDKPPRRPGRSDFCIGDCTGCNGPYCILEYYRVDTRSPSDASQTSLKRQFRACCRGYWSGSSPQLSHPDPTACRTPGIRLHAPAHLTCSMRSDCMYQRFVVDQANERWLPTFARKRPRWLGAVWTGRKDGS